MSRAWCGFALTLALTACSGGVASRTTDPPEDPPPVVATLAPGDRAEIGGQYRHEISTHCGIVATVFDRREWLADPPLSDGNANPPRGWDNPTEVGVIRLVDADHAEFSGRNGGVARFRARTRNDPPLPGCD